MGKIAGGEDGVDVDTDSVFDAASVAAGERDGDGDAEAAGVLENNRVAAAKAFESEREAAKLIFAVGVGAAEVEEQVGVEIVERVHKIFLEDGDVIVVVGAIGEMEVDVRGRLGHGVVVFLMDGESEDVGISGEDAGSAVALVDIGVDDHDGADGAIGLEAADGNGDVVDHAEAFAVAGEGVMEAAANVGGKAVGQCALGGKDGAASGEPEGFDGFLGVRDFQAHLLGGRKCAGLELADPFLCVDAEDVGIGGGLRGEKVGELGEALSQESFADEAIFLRGKDVGAEVEVVMLVVDELEGQHGTRGSDYLQGCNESTGGRTPHSPATNMVHED